MRPIPIAFAQSSAQTRHGHEGAARLVNCYSEVTGKQAESGSVVYAIDGWRQFSTTPVAGGVRAMLDLGSRLLAVIGRQVVTIDSSGAATLIGGLPSDGLVTMAANKRAPAAQVAICCDGLIYMEQGGVYRQITDPDINAATSVVELDGYMVYLDRRGKIVSSDLNSADVIDGLSFATAEASADDGVRAARRGQELVLFGSTTTEFWANVAGDPFPFGRTTVSQFGCAAAGSVATIGGTLAFVDHRKQVRMLNGYQADQISIGPVDRALEGEPDLSAVRGFSWVERGHEMYGLTGSAWTWVYDTATGMWHERQSQRRERWRASCAVMFAGRTLFGADDRPTIYAAEHALMDEAGNEIVMVMQSPPVTAFPSRLFWDRLDLRVIPGVGLNADDIEIRVPSIMLDLSEDGGRTWGAQRALQVGQMAEQLRTVYATRLGLAPAGGRVLRLSMSASVARGLVSGFLTTRKAA